MNNPTHNAASLDTSRHGSASYNSIDLVKFFLSLFVCAIHIAPFNPTSCELFKYFSFGIQQYLARLAVPFFFICSGFFLFRKTNHTEHKNDIVKKYCFKLIGLLGVWHILLVNSSTVHLWYIGATIVAIAIIWQLRGFNLKPQYLALIAGGLYAIGLFGDSYYGLAKNILQTRPFYYLEITYSFFYNTTRNGLFMGFLFVLLGSFFACGKIRIKKAYALAGFLVSMLLFLMEAFLLQYKNIPKDHNMYVFLVPAVTFFFAFIIQIKLKDRPIYKKLRIAGVLIYFMHMLVYKLLRFGALYVLKTTDATFTSYAFWITFPTTTGLAFAIEYLSRKKHFTWLRWLYS